MLVSAAEAPMLRPHALAWQALVCDDDGQRDAKTMLAPAELRALERGGPCALLG